MGILDRNYNSYWYHKGYEENDKVIEFFTKKGKKLLYEVINNGHSWVVKVFDKISAYSISDIVTFQDAEKIVDDLEISYKKRKSIAPMIGILSITYKVDRLSKVDSYSLKECRFV